MKKLLKALAAAGVVAMFGAAVLPLATYAATDTTTVQVTIGQECQIGGGGVGSGGAGNLSLNLSATTSLYGVANSTNGSNSIEVVCNNDTWTLTEQINAGSTVNLVGGTTAVSGFTPWTAATGTGDASGFADNTWAMRYAEVTPQTSNSVSATSWHAVPANGGTPVTIANGVATAGYEIQQFFGAKTDGTLAADTYSSVVLYTLTGTNT